MVALVCVIAPLTLAIARRIRRRAAAAEVIALLTIRASLVLGRAHRARRRPGAAAATAARRERSSPPPSHTWDCTSRRWCTATTPTSSYRPTELPSVLCGNPATAMREYADAV